MEFLRNILGWFRTRRTPVSGASVTPRGIARDGIVIEFGAGPENSMYALSAMQLRHYENGCNLGKERCGFCHAEEDGWTPDQDRNNKTATA